jgi:hypothetical protein
MRKGLAFAFGIAFFGLVALSFSFQPGDVTAAPQAAPTPFVYERNAAARPTIVTFYNGDPYTISKEICLNLLPYDAGELQYTIDQGATPNTVTLVMRHTNEDGYLNLTTGDSVVANSAADANAMVAVHLFGRISCLQVTDSNTRTYTITARMKVK